MVILPTERKTLKAGIFLGAIYMLLILGGLTMVMPFLMMITSSFTGPYDYYRHDVIPHSLWNRADRFMLSISTVFKRFPREYFPDAPASWGAWSSVARDAEGVQKFAEKHLDPVLRDSALLEEWKNEASAFIKFNASYDIAKSVCNYDPREVPGFLKSKYSTVEAMNKAWPVGYKSFFDVSFSMESKRRIAKASNGKEAAWLEFADLYRHVPEGEYMCRTLPASSTVPEGIDCQWKPGSKWPVAKCLAVQFAEHGWRDYFTNAVSNYTTVFKYLFVRGRAFINTIWLVILSVLAALTVNPLAAYALSRFRLSCTGRIIVFLLATAAFPAAVTAIPGFLLIRDLGLLNTFAALVLPTAASGMGIFILKGFFDALPRELYEAAAIDGAGEWLIFRKITLPMTTPILAVHALGAFIAAYNGWAWAFLVCQKESHWTVAVWMYQMSQIYAGQPWTVMAGFVVVSIPTALVFLLCQKVVLRGIVLPSMK